MNKKLVCDNNKCTGCGACLNICPRSCISLVKDEFDVLNAQINDEVCIKCNRCRELCPQNKDIIEGSESSKCYAAWSIDVETRQHSASGGIATELYSIFLNKGGYICGTYIDDNYNVLFKLTNEYHWIKYFQNSKYSHAELSGIYVPLANILKSGNQVLIVGVPCQIAGIRAYLAHSNISCENLYCIDLVCHGGAPNSYLKAHINYINKKYKSFARKVSFRDPEFRTHTYTFTLRDYQNNLIYKRKVNQNDNYQIGYHKGIIYRENCYSCKYACTKRTGDITLADFSSVGKYKICTYSNENVSCILVNSSKGYQLIDELLSSGRIFADERDIREEYDVEMRLHKPIEKPCGRDIFESRYLKSRNFEYSIKTSVRQYKFDNIVLGIKELMVLLIPPSLYKVISKMRTKLLGT